MIPHEYIEELTRRTDIVELVGSYVQLKRKGRLYGGLCPFHSEKTPSFYVYPDTQSFYCFGCQAAGDAISFVKKINNISSGEAIKMLASRAGMPEPQEDDKTGRLRSRVLSMNKEAARFFHACLNSTVEEARQARAYWRRRGLDDKTIVRFGRCCGNIAVESSPCSFLIGVYKKEANAQWNCQQKNKRNRQSL